MENLTNEELVDLYQKEDNDMGFNELYIRNKGLLHSIKLSYKNTILIDQITIESACNLGFTLAVKTFKKGSSNCKFSTFCYRAMTNEVNKSIKFAGRKMRNPLDHRFLYLDDVAINGDGSKVIDLIDLSSYDPLIIKDYTLLYEALEYAKSKIEDKYHPYIIDLLLNETSTPNVSKLIGVHRSTVLYTVNRFKRIAKEHILNQNS